MERYKVKQIGSTYSVPIDDIVDGDIDALIDKGYRFNIVDSEEEDTGDDYDRL